MSAPRDHGGGLDAAIARYGGSRAEWLDLSTGINPVPYPYDNIPPHAFTALPDMAAQTRLITAARAFWQVPDGAEVIAAAGASALIAKLPALTDRIGAYIPAPTYNEHAAAFRAHHQLTGDEDASAQVHVYVHPNNPDGRLWPASTIGGRALTVVDESFCDVMPAASHVAKAAQAGTIVLKSFGKFWGLAGLRLGFAIGAPATLFPQLATTGAPLADTSLADMLGPWAVSGPALEIGARALEDTGWATTTRARLAKDAARLDRIMQPHGTLAGGTDLFRLYDVGDAAAFQDRLAQAHVWSRIFPYSRGWVRLGLPAPDRWDQLAAALDGPQG